MLCLCTKRYGTSFASNQSDGSEQLDPQLGHFIVTRGEDMWLKMVLNDGLLHADLHPGNILVHAPEVLVDYCVCVDFCCWRYFFGVFSVVSVVSVIFVTFGFVIVVFTSIVDDFFGVVAIVADVVNADAADAADVVNVVGVFVVFVVVAGGAVCFVVGRGVIACFFTFNRACRE